MTTPQESVPGAPAGNAPIQILDDAVEILRQKKGRWAALSIKERLVYLRDIRERIASVAPAWAKSAVAAKGLEQAHSLAGEEWMSGPWALLRCAKQLIETLERIDAGIHRELPNLTKRSLRSGQEIVEVFPRTLFDRLLISGVRAEVWMEPGVSANAVAARYSGKHAAVGEVGLVLGAGNIASIAPLDSLYKLYTDLAVVMLKLNPVNDYLGAYIEDVFASLIRDGYLRVAYGGPDVGAYLCSHPAIDTIHITGSAATHDAIVFGAQKQSDVPRRRINSKPITSELGGVSPVIVVPGPWNQADIAFQARNIATQRLHNGGFNCIASQILVLPDGWEHAAALENAVARAFSDAPERPPYYPGAEQRQERFRQTYDCKLGAKTSATGKRHLLIPLDAQASGQDQLVYRDEAFAPVLGIPRLAFTDELDFLRKAVDFANDRLAGTLGANIIIHPATLKKLGPSFEQELARLRYGCIAVNLWTGAGFLLTETSWGAFPGHSIDDVQSGIGKVHNTMMFDHPQKSVLYGPFQPFPRSMLAGRASMLPVPPWFVSHRSADKVAEHLFAFEVAPSWLKLPSIMWHALRS